MFDLSTVNDQEIAGMVHTNNKDGIIMDCYSSNFAITKNTNAITNVYGYAYNNYGLISNCLYFIPELVEYDNIAGVTEVSFLFFARNG